MTTGKWMSPSGCFFRVCGHTRVHRVVFVNIQLSSTPFVTHLPLGVQPSPSASQCTAESRTLACLHDGSSPQERRLAAPSNSLQSAPRKTAAFPGALESNPHTRSWNDRTLPADPCIYTESTRARRSGMCNRSARHTPPRTLFPLPRHLLLKFHHPALITTIITTSRILRSSRSRMLCSLHQTHFPNTPSQARCLSHDRMHPSHRLHRPAGHLALIPLPPLRSRAGTNRIPAQPRLPSQEGT